MSEAGATTTKATERAQRDAVYTELSGLYPGPLALGLIHVCPPRPHTHRDKHGRDVQCDKLGKRPLDAGWNTRARERYANGADREAHLRSKVEHLASGGNIGWTPPPGLLPIDADTPKAVAYFGKAVPDAPMQVSSKGAHFVLRVPEDLEIKAQIKVKLAPGVEVDLRPSGRGQIVCEPSVHATGFAYTWHRPLPESLDGIPFCPPVILDVIRKAVSEETGRRREAKSGNGEAGKRTLREGERNDTLFRDACAMRRRGLSAAAIRAALDVENAKAEPPLSDDEIDSIAKSAGRYEPEPDPPPSEDSGLPTPSSYFDDHGLKVEKLGKLIEAEGNIRLGIDGRLYRYRQGVYRNDGKTFTKARLRELLGERFKRRHSDEVLAWLDAVEPTVGEHQPEEFLNVANGLLDWRSQTLHDHDPKIISTVQYPVRWNPETRCPGIDRFLREVLPEDAIGFVIEVIGYALYTRNPLRVAILLLGPGANGKTVLLRIIVSLLGERNVSTIPLQAFSENRFAAAELFGKTANICGDLDARAIKQTDVFKCLTGGDAMMAERKYGAPFSFRPTSLPIFSANEPPLSSDQSEAWFDRWRIVPMETRIPEARRDPHLIHKLTTNPELEGLLAQAVEGLRRVMDRGRFELPESVRKAGEGYRERLDTVRGFVAECCQLNPDLWTPRTVLYQFYKDWAQGGGRIPLPNVTFYSHLRRGFAGQIEERPREGKRGWIGIGIQGGSL